MNIRQEKILEILKVKKNISIEKLCEILAYSSSTIRRDIIALQEMGLVKRDKGNVRLLVSNSKEKHFKLRSAENLDKKKIIAELVTDFITDGMSIFLDASTTTLQICSNLTKYKNLTVVTNGIEIVHYLIHHSTVEIFMVGGYVREGSSAIIGEPAIDYIKQFNLDLCIVACTGIDEGGFYEPSLQQSIVKQNMIKQAQTSIMLCDSSKFNQKFKFTLAQYYEIDYLITDEKPLDEIEREAEFNNCEIIYPEK
ncbi:MAG: DeoR/GlpR family DNA-binding transcription regulator [Cellulosilyticaceae bacterium]